MITLSAILLVSVGATTQLAQTVDPQARAGISAFEELRYRDAIVLLERALTIATLSRDDRLATLATLARAHAIVHNDGAARAAFGQVLELTPTYLVGYDEPPAVTRNFQEARAEFVRLHPDATMPVMLQAPPPPRRAIWPWVVGGTVLAAAAVAVIVVVVGHHGQDQPVGINDQWQLP